MDFHGQYCFYIMMAWNFTQLKVFYFVLLGTTKNTTKNNKAAFC